MTKPTTTAKRNHLLHLLAATRNTFDGLKVAIKETAFQQELALIVPHAILIYVFHIKFLPALFLTALWFIILAGELLNTAMEAVVDLASPDIHPLAKIAKDTASAAVGCLLTAFFISWALVILLS